MIMFVVVVAGVVTGGLFFVYARYSLSSSRVAYAQGDFTVACLVIGNTHKPRWRREKAYWLARRVPANVDVYMLDCDDDTTGLRCTETIVPGIYQKSLQGLRAACARQYTLYLRTNGSTFVDFECLQAQVANRRLVRNDAPPFFTGGLLFDWGVSGTSIVLNHAAASLLVHHGFHPRYYHDTKTPDDVLISNVMKDHAVRVAPNDGLRLYRWNPNESYATNQAERARLGAPFVRLRHLSDDATTERLKKAMESIIYGQTACNASSTHGDPDRDHADHGSSRGGARHTERGGVRG